MDTMYCYSLYMHGSLIYISLLCSTFVDVVSLAEVDTSIYWNAKVVHFKVPNVLQSTGGIACFCFKCLFQYKETECLKCQWFKRSVTSSDPFQQHNVKTEREQFFFGKVISSSNKVRKDNVMQQVQCHSHNKNSCGPRILTLLVAISQSIYSFDVPILIFN